MDILHRTLWLLRQKSQKVVLFGSNFVSDALSQTPVFGPERYIRETGEPQKITKTFSVQNIEGEFTLNVQNREGKRGMFGSAVIELNGVCVVGPSEFNKRVDLITKPINLKQQNEISIEVRSQQGIWIIVTILGAGVPSQTLSAKLRILDVVRRWVPVP